MDNEGDWRAELDRWLEPFLAELNRAARRTMCPHYVAGLIGLGERKSMQPMAARQDGLSYDRLQHFISVGRWDDAPLARALLAEADRMVGGRDAVLVIDDTSLPKKGRHSVGVAPQYLSTQGKTGNCQALVSFTLARREVPVLVGLRLFLPTSWTDDAARMARAGVPKAAQTPRTKPEIALGEVDRVRAAGIRFGLVLADAGYGCSATFRAGLSARGLAWAAGVPSNVEVYPADVKLLPAELKPGRPSDFLLPDKASEPAEAVLGRAKWRSVTWRSGTKGRLRARFAALRVRVADGPTRRIGGKARAWVAGSGCCVEGRRTGLGRHPVPRQQLIKASGGVRGDAAEHVGQPGLRVEVVQLRRHDQAVEPPKSHAFLPRARPRSALSAPLFVMHTRPSSRKRVKDGQRSSM